MVLVLVWVCKPVGGGAVWTEPLASQAALGAGGQRRVKSAPSVWIPRAQLIKKGPRFILSPPIHLSVRPSCHQTAEETVTFCGVAPSSSTKYLQNQRWHELSSRTVVYAGCVLISSEFAQCKGSNKVSFLRRSPLPTPHLTGQDPVWNIFSSIPPVLCFKGRKTHVCSFCWEEWILAFVHNFTANKWVKSYWQTLKDNIVQFSWAQTVHIQAKI